MLSWPDFLLEVQLLWSTILEISFNRKELLSPSPVLSLSSFSFFVRHMKATESGGMRLHSPSGGWYSEAVFGGSLLCSSLCPLSLYTFPSGIYRHWWHCPEPSRQAQQPPIFLCWSWTRPSAPGLDPALLSWGKDPLSTCCLASSVDVAGELSPQHLKGENREEGMGWHCCEHSLNCVETWDCKELLVGSTTTVYFFFFFSPTLLQLGLSVKSWDFLHVKLL